MTLRQYTPKVGQTVKMREWNDYTSRGIHVWSWLKVNAVHETCVTFQVLNGNEPTNNFSSCPLSAIEPPLGWEPRYTIYCKPEQAQTIVSNWFTRGIVVRQSHNLSGNMPTAFQPMDNADIPHWQFPEETDAILPEQCAEIFRVVAVEQEEINYPNLRDMGRSKRVQAIRAMESEGWKVTYCRYAYGFWERTRETIVHNWSE